LLILSERIFDSSVDAGKPSLIAAPAGLGNASERFH